MLHDNSLTTLLLTLLLLYVPFIPFNPDFHNEECEKTALAPGLQQSPGATLAAETDALLYLPYVWKKINAGIYKKVVHACMGGLSSFLGSSLTGLRHTVYWRWKHW